MINFSESISVRRTIEDTFFYISNFENIAEWDPGVASAVSITSGGPHEGAQYSLMVKFGISTFPMEYKVKKIDHNKELILEGTGENQKAIDHIKLKSIDGETTEIEYIVTLTLFGFVGKLEGLLKPMIVNSMSNSLEGLRHALDPQLLHPPERSFLNRVGDALVLPGMLSFSSWGYAARKGSWLPVTENMRGKTVVITGASSGLGRETAKALGRLGASLVLVARNKDKLQQLKNDIEYSFGNDSVDFYPTDLSSLRATRDLSLKLRKKYKSIDVLINNAGALFNERKLTEEQNEMSLSLLLLSPVVFTLNLFPSLLKSGGARVINVSSGGMYTTGIKANDLQFQDTNYNGPLAYARAKRGLVMMSKIWSREWFDNKITVNSMHPGWADTPGVESSLPGFYRLTRFFLRTPEQGADSIIWLAASRQAEAMTGKFIFDREPHPTSVLPGTAPTSADYDDFLKVWCLPISSTDS